MTSTNTWGPSSRQQWISFMVLCVVVLLGTAGYVYRVIARTDAAGPVRVPHAVGSTVQTTRPAALAALRARPHVAFRNLVPGPHDGLLAFAALDDLGWRHATDLNCFRLHSAGGLTLCLDLNTVGQPFGYLLDDSLTIRRVFRTFGIPSRVRVSRDGRAAAYTVFKGGDSYMAAGFSTRTRLLRSDTDRTSLDLERFTAWRDGLEFHSIDFNYWGVTFTRDRSRFFATLGTQGHTYLVEGNVDLKRITVIADGVECPSLSPDETRIAFKKRTAPGTWRPAILNLATRAERLLPEGRNVDDQIEWLDGDHVLYAIGRSDGKRPGADIWMISADSGQGPALFLSDADSPAIVYPASAR